MASRHYFYRIFQMQIYTDKSSTIRESHLHALLDLQETSVLQALFEIIRPNFSMAENESEGVRHAICFFTHQVFIKTPKYLKLVHFQGFPDDLIPILVENVPSMHICFEFIPELVIQPHPSKALFGVQLASYLFEKYPLPSSHALAHDVILPRIAHLGRHANQITSDINSTTTTTSTTATTTITYNKNNNTNNNNNISVEDIINILLISLVKVTRAFPVLSERVKEVVNVVTTDKPRTEWLQHAVVRCLDEMDAVLVDEELCNKSRM